MRGEHISIFAGLDFWFAVEPAGVAILGFCAAALMISSGLIPGRRRLATGMLLASGIQTVLLFAGYQFASPPPHQHPGSAAIVGMAGLLLVAAGVLGTVSSISGPAMHPAPR